MEFTPHNDFKNPEMALEWMACSAFPFILEEFNKFLNGQSWFHTYHNITRSTMYEEVLMCEKLNALHFLHFKKWPKLMVKVQSTTGLTQGIFDNRYLPNCEKFWNKNIMFYAPEGGACGTLVLNDSGEFERREYWNYGKK